MSDVDYMNTYVSVALETVHSYVNDTLQLKTQIKVLNDLVSQKDQVVQDLSAQLQSLNMENEGRRSTEGEMQTEMQTLRENASSWESQYNNIVNKVSHMDTLTNQYNELKGQYIQKENELNNVSNELSRIMNEFNAKNSECEGLKQSIESLQKHREDEVASLQKQREDEVASLQGELESTKSKLDKLTKKEEKKTTVSLVEVPSKKVINKESNNAISIPRKVMNVPQETDDF